MTTDYNNNTKPYLIDLLQSRSLPHKGNKSELVKRLQQHDAARMSQLRPYVRSTTAAAESPFLKTFTDPKNRLNPTNRHFKLWQRLWNQAHPVAGDSNIAELQQWMTRIQSYFEKQMKVTNDYRPKEVFDILEQCENQTDVLDTPPHILKVSKHDPLKSSI